MYFVFKIIVIILCGLYVCFQMKKKSPLILIIEIRKKGK